MYWWMLRSFLPLGNQLAYGGEDGNVFSLAAARAVVCVGESATCFLSTAACRFNCMEAMRPLVGSADICATYAFTSFALSGSLAASVLDMASASDAAPERVASATALGGV